LRVTGKSSPADGTAVGGVRMIPDNYNR